MNTNKIITVPGFIYLFILFLSARSAPPAFAFAGPPSFTLTCPDDYVIQLEPGECGTVVSFDTLEWSTTEPVTDSLFFPPSGTFFQVGTSPVTLAVTYQNGTLETCTFNVILEEFIPETLSCQNQVFLSLQEQCERELMPGELLDPDSTGCVDNYSVIRLSPSGQPLPPVISAFDINSTFLAVVEHTGNGMQCLTQVTVTGGTPPSITCPPSVTIFCNVPIDTSVSGYPAYSGCYEELDIVYFDEVTSANCVDTFAFQMIRHWISTDPYGKKDTCDQLITAVRYDINQVQFPEDYNGIEQPALECDPGMTPAEIADPGITGIPLFMNHPTNTTEDCEVSTGYQDFTTEICGGNVDITRVWTVVKLCPPTFTIRDTQFIKIVDNLPPSFSVPDTLYVSSYQQCTDTFLIRGATDVVECGEFTAQIITPWDTLNTNGGITHANLSPGFYPLTYTLTDDCGQSHTDSVVMQIDEEILVSCPPDDTISCDYYINTIAPAVQNNNFDILAQLGMPEFHENCEFEVTETDSFSLTNCGDGVLFRTLTSESSTPATCVQEITIVHVSDFEIIFPKDTSICVHPDSVNLGSPVYINVSCENMNVEMQQTVLPKGLIGCYTLKRKWIVSNSCIYGGINTFDDIQLGSRHFRDGGDGVIEYEQTIEVSNEVTPVFTNGCQISNLYVPAGACKASIIVPSPEINACGNHNLTLSGGLGTNIGVNVNLDPGNYQATYRATDQCGKQGSCVTQFMVRDTISPDFNCSIPPAIVELQPYPNPGDTPFAILELDSLDLAASDNCTGIRFSFFPDTIIRTRLYDCSFAGLTTTATIWAIDDYNNAASCEISVEIIDPDEVCEADVVLSGTVLTETGDAVGNVTILVESSAGTTDSVGVQPNGNWSATVPSGFDYTIVPGKNINPVNGVTTFDGVLITRHILGIDTLEGAYKVIAADINRSGAVTTFDIVELRRLILNIYMSFPNNTSWRFIPGDIVFPNPLNPWQEPFTGSIFLPNVQQDVSGLDFIGVKTGDVNLNADPSN